MQKLASKGHTIIIVTHNLLEVEKYADNYALFNNGKLLKSGKVKQIIHDKLYQISFDFMTKSILDKIEDYTIINGVSCQLEIEERSLAPLIAQLTEELGQKTISNLSLHQKTLTISDLYREELTN